MSGRNIEDFFSDPEAFDALNEEDKARLLAGESLEGETDANTDTEGEAGESQATEGEGETAEESSATPAAATPEEGKKEEAEPVVLAKDGKNTIPFSVLEAERERARQLEQELAALKQAPAGSQEAGQKSAEEGAQATATEQISALVTERDEALYSGDTDRAHEISMKIIGIQNTIAASSALEQLRAENSARKEQETQEQAMATATERANALVEKYPFLNPEAPTANQVAIDGVVAERNRLVAAGMPLADAIVQAVAKVAPLFEQKTTTTPPADATAKAAEAIAKAKAQVPTSLSQVPAGSAAHHDEGEAIRNKSGLSLMQTFEGKSSDEILKLMSRVI